MFVHALEGGALIGASAALLLLLLGRIAGVSGIFGRVVAGDAGHGRWRLAFVVGLVVAPMLARLAGMALPAPHLNGAIGTALVGGLLTGVGTGLAAGCTSGHGVCGLSNLSLRSLAATLTFMGVAAATVFVVRHFPGA